MPASLVERIVVPPLSRDAVRSLADGSSLDAAVLFDATAGNPFFVTEVVAAPADDVPATVRDAVIARLGRLSLEARLMVRAAAALGDRCETALLLAVHGRDEAPLVECLGSGVLVADAGAIRFRHELARRAVLASIDIGARRDLHRRALAALREGDIAAGPDLLATHAVGAGGHDSLLELAPLAGHRAASLGAHREAVAYFAAASALRHELDPRARAFLLEAHARECALIDDAASALELQQEALACWQVLGDRLGEGACLRALSAMWYQAGQGERAQEVARAAVSILETVVPVGHELALALATLGQRVMVAGHDDAEALDRATRARDVAEGLGDEPVVAHALTTIGVARIYMSDEAGWAILEEGIHRAQAGGL
ncbi:hypothetical protein BH24CHL9_BH24CHL9_00110 [soil metagenome]